MNAEQLRPVLLPDQEWVSFWYIRRAIFDAYLLDPNASSGVSLVTAKALTSRQVRGITFRLRPEDRALLEQVSSLLAPITFGMTSGEWKKVARTFGALTKKHSINWAPVKPHERDFSAEQNRRVSVCDVHVQALRDLVRTREIEALAGSHVQVVTVGTDTKVARRQVEAYFESCGLFYLVGSNEPVREATRTHRELEPLEWDEPTSPATQTPNIDPWPWPDWPKELLEELSRRQGRGEPWSELAADLVRRKLRKTITPMRVSQVVGRYRILLRDSSREIV